MGKRLGTGRASQDPGLRGTTASRQSQRQGLLVRLALGTLGTLGAATGPRHRGQRWRSERYRQSGAGATNSTVRVLASIVPYGPATRSL